MNFKATKTPLLIAAMATAVALNTFVPANAATPWTSAGPANLQAVDGDIQVIDAKFKFKKFSPTQKFGGHSSIKKKKLVPTHSFGKKQKFKPKHSFGKKKVLGGLF